MRVLVLIWCFLLFPLLLHAEEPTTNTLRLAQVFDLHPGEGGFLPSPGQFDPNGPVVVIPDTSAWRVPPTPTPTPVPTPFLDLQGNPVSLPRLPLRLGGEDDKVKLNRSPAFTFRGNTIALGATGRAQLHVATPFHLLRAQYILSGQPDARGSKPVQLTFFHTPGSRETFDVPAGEYRLVRRLWRAEKPDSLIEEKYDDQHLNSAGEYEFAPAPEEEQGLLAKLRSMD